MPTLSLRQHSEPNGQHRVEVRLSGVDNQADMTAVSTFSFELTENDRAPAGSAGADKRSEPMSPGHFLIALRFAPSSLAAPLNSTNRMHHRLNNGATPFRRSTGLSCFVKILAETRRRQGNSGAARPRAVRLPAEARRLQGIICTEQDSPAPVNSQGVPGVVHVSWPAKSCRTGLRRLRDKDSEA
jgi:hypothetical protein